MSEDTSKTRQNDNGDDATDVQLMRLVGEGDQQALRILVTKWQTPLINFFYRSLRSVQTAEDLTQTVFIRLYRNASTYEPRARFSSYIFHIARNILLNEHRRLRRKPAEPCDPTDFTTEISIDNQSERRCAEIEESFASALLQLSENQRTALLLHKQQELSYEEIANVMDATVSLVKAWIFRGRQKLREILKDL
ncbi:MAG: RNA polymerase sigma factor [Puniceicoccales bacterium]|jgi:RNA polymerase sigma-70 factor (ECF subfamily)|nr:RNA polymerase sigma factor [Puniceicoccales bacterium]